MKKQNKKKIIITVTAVVLVVAIGLGVWFGVSRGRSEPVKVFAFNSVGMTEYWGDSQESYGPVSTDKIQTVFLSSTQTVTEMKVAQGDEVKKGDVLMTFDTTLSDLQLERKRLEVEKLKLDLETAQKKLKDIRNMKPMSIVSPDDFDNSDEDSDDEGDLKKDYELSYDHAYDGSESGKALICWLRLTTNANGDRVTPTVDDALLDLLQNEGLRLLPHLGGLGGDGSQKAVISLVGGVVLLNKIAHVHQMAPLAGAESFPCGAVDIDAHRSRSFLSCVFARLSHFIIRQVSLSRRFQSSNAVLSIGGTPSRA